LAFIPLNELRLRFKSKAAVPWGRKVNRMTSLDVRFVFALMSDRKLPHQEQDALMSTTFDGTNRDQLLAARRAALTKALKSYRATEDKDIGPIAAAKAANVINLAPHWDSLRMRLLVTDVPREVYRLLSKTMLRQKPKAAPLSRRRQCRGDGHHVQPRTRSTAHSACEYWSK